MTLIDFCFPTLLPTLYRLWLEKSREKTWEYFELYNTHVSKLFFEIVKNVLQ